MYGHGIGATFDGLNHQLLALLWWPQESANLITQNRKTFEQTSQLELLLHNLKSQLLE